MTTIFGIILLGWFTGLGFILGRQFGKEESEKNFVTLMADNLQISEHAVFVRAGKKWNRSSVTVEEDFIEYVKYQEEIPFYVNDFVRSE